MAHLSLPNSELHIGITAVGNARLEALCAQPGVAVLFPSEGATDVTELSTPPSHLVVVDGTWSNAKKVVEKCPALSKLPRLKFFPDRPGNYRIRKEPEAHCLATIEATAFVLEQLERQPGRFTPILTAFDAMVDKQLDYIDANRDGSRHRLRKKRNSVKVDPLAPLRAAKLVAIFGEANAWPVTDPARPQPEVAELVQLVAERVAPPERFERVLRPARPLGPRVPLHLDLAEDTILRADARDEVLQAFDAFLAGDELMVGWGRFCNDLLLREGRARPFVNLRSVLGQLWQGTPGSVELLAEANGAALSAGRGRAIRRLEALSYVLRKALDGSLQKPA